jgi:hypothetical protein
MAIVSFNQYKQQILDAIQNKVLSKGLVPPDPQGFILIEGFLNIPLQQDIGGGISIGGPTIPAVAIVGKSTGLMHTFAVKALLPTIEIS